MGQVNKNGKSSFYAKYLLPGVILQSVLIGGGYATGREIYQYGAMFGSMGWISGITIAIGFSLFAFLTLEICRIYKVYDYKNFIKQVIGPLWPVMDILTILIGILQKRSACDRRIRFQGPRFQLFESQNAETGRVSCSI